MTYINIIPLYINYGWAWFVKWIFFEFCFTSNHRALRVVKFFKYGMAIHIGQYSFVFNLKLC